MDEEKLDEQEVKAGVRVLKEAYQAVLDCPRTSLVRGHFACGPGYELGAIIGSAA